MKSHELTLIRAEGLDSRPLQFFIYLNESCYGIIDLSTSTSKSLVLPSSGLLGLKVCEQGSLIGEIFVNILSLEQNGLQWLPILETNSQALFELPEEVPSPRVLISLYSSKTKVPGKPIEPPSYIKPSKSPEELFNDCEIIEDIESFDESKIEKNEIFSEIAEIRLEKSEETEEKNLNNEKPNCKNFSIDLEELVESLNYDLNKSQKKNYEKNRMIRELKIQIAALSKSFQSFNQQDSNSKLEVTEVLKYQEKINELEDLVEAQGFKIQDLNELASGLKAGIAEKEEIIKNQESLIEEQDEIIKELEAGQVEFEAILSQKEVEAELSQLSLRETVKSLELRLKESVMSLDLLESNFKETTSRAIQLEVSLFELQKKNEQEIEALKHVECVQEFKQQSCPSCEKLQIEIKGHSENTKRLYQTIQAITDKLNTSEFHNQELLISTQDLQQELETLKSRSNQTLLSNSLPQDDLDTIFQSLHPLQFCKSVKLVPSIYLINNKKVQITKTSEKLKFFQDNHEIFISDPELKHEKNSLSLEDISNQIENFKSQNMIHSRVTSRENKLRVLTKQW